MSSSCNPPRTWFIKRLMVQAKQISTSSEVGDGFNTTQNCFWHAVDFHVSLLSQMSCGTSSTISSSEPSLANQILTRGDTIKHTSSPHFFAKSAANCSLASSVCQRLGRYTTPPPNRIRRKTHGVIGGFTTANQSLIVLIGKAIQRFLVDFQYSRQSRKQGGIDVS